MNHLSLSSCTRVTDNNGSLILNDKNGPVVGPTVYGAAYLPASTVQLAVPGAVVGVLCKVK